MYTGILSDLAGQKRPGKSCSKSYKDKDIAI